MPSVKFNQASNAVETGEAFLSLLEFTHLDMPDPLYFVDDIREVVSGGKTYLPYPFRITLPEDKENVVPSVNLTIDNVDRLLIEAVRQFSSPPEVTLKIVLSSAPDNIEIQLDNLKLRNIRFDAYTISASLLMDSPLGRIFPSSIYDPKQYFALFFR